MIGDSYRFTRADYRAMRLQSERLLLFDDFGTQREPCDWLLCPSLTAPKIAPFGGARLLLGPKFQPMRREYWSKPPRRQFSAVIGRCLVTLGGGESDGLTLLAVDAIRAAFPDAAIEVVLGTVEASRFDAGPRRRVRVRWGLPSLRASMIRCDLAVSGGGQTLLELAACGTPAVAVVRAGNQDANVERLAKSGCAASAGWWADRGLKSRLEDILRRFDRRRRGSMSLAGRRLVDGQGALRVARILVR